MQSHSLFSTRPAAVITEDTALTGVLRLGNYTREGVPLVRTPDGKSGFFLYIKLNEELELMEEAVRLIHERVLALGIEKPHFVTPEASTYGLAILLKKYYGYETTVIKKSVSINDSVKPFKAEYKSVTSKKDETKELYLGRNQAAKLKDQTLIILDSVCTTGSTLKATHDLMVAAGIQPEKIVEATVLFTEGQDPKELEVANGRKLPLHSFAHLPLVGLNIGLAATTSSIKLQAIKTSLRETMPDFKWHVDGVDAESGKPEQPEGNETIEGAFNRAMDAKAKNPNSDVIISIESGIFKQPDGKYFDKAIIFCLTPDGKAHMMESDSIEFPAEYVEEARNSEGGFAKNTVGMIMQKHGIVKDHKDPHKCLSKDGRTRADYIHDALVILCQKVLRPYYDAAKLGQSAVSTLKPKL